MNVFQRTGDGHPLEPSALGILIHELGDDGFRAHLGKGPMAFLVDPIFRYFVQSRHHQGDRFFQFHFSGQSDRKTLPPCTEFVRVAADYLQTCPAY